MRFCPWTARENVEVVNCCCWSSIPISILSPSFPTFAFWFVNADAYIVPSVRYRDGISGQRRERFHRGRFHAQVPRVPLYTSSSRLVSRDIHIHIHRQQSRSPSEEAGRPSLLRKLRPETGKSQKKGGGYYLKVDPVARRRALKGESVEQI